jgi:transcriptional regulator with XRE-family HTH domain
METSLRQYRQQHGITLRDLAARVGMKEPHLSRVERGEAGLSVANALKIMAATGLSLEQLAPDPANDPSPHSEAA